MRPLCFVAIALVPFVGGACSGVAQQHGSALAGASSIGIPHDGEGGGASADRGGAGSEGRTAGDAQGAAAPRSTGRPGKSAPDAPAERGAAPGSAGGERAHGQGSESMRNRGSRVVEGSRGDVTWHVNAWHEGKATCVSLNSRGPTGGGGSGTCSQRLPLGVSLQRSVDGRFAWGLASSEIVRVRFDHHGGETETFETAAAVGFDERFYGGLIAPTTFARIVGLDAAGRVIAEYDVASLNRVPV